MDTTQDGEGGDGVKAGKDSGAPDKDAKQINLKVLQDGKAVHFKVNQNTALKELVNAYVDLQRKAIRLRYEGRPVAESDTPMGLEMKEGDTVEVFMEPLRCCCSTDVNPRDGVKGDGGKGEKERALDKDAKYINIKVRGFDRIFHYRMKKSIVLGKLKSAYAERAKLHRNKFRFIHIEQGRYVLDSDTPMGLEMKEGDTLEVILKMRGG